MGGSKRIHYNNNVLSEVASKVFWDTIDLSTPQKVIEKCNELISKIPEIKMRYGNTPENNLFHELQLWPSYFEWISSDGYSTNGKYKLELNDRLDFFKDRLIKQHKNYKSTIELYCALYKKLKTNPLLIRTFSEQILSTLNEKKNN